MEKQWYQEYRCTCGKLLCKGLLVDSEVEIKCKTCHKLTTIKGVDKDALVCHVVNCPHRV